MQELLSSYRAKELMTDTTKLKDLSIKIETLEWVLEDTKKKK